MVGLCGEPDLYGNTNGIGSDESVGLSNIHRPDLLHRSYYHNGNPSANQESMKILTDILQTKDKEKGDQLKYSQSRVYLMISFVLMISLIISGVFVEISDSIYQYTLYLIFAFSGYGIGSKGIKNIINQKNTSKNTPSRGR